DSASGQRSRHPQYQHYARPLERSRQHQYQTDREHDAPLWHLHCDGHGFGSEQSECERDLQRRHEQHGNEDAQIRYNGTESPETTAINLTVRHVKISGLGRGIGLTVGASRTVNSNIIKQLHVLVEDSSFSDLTGEAVYWSQNRTTPIGQAGGAVIDLGGGTLGSHGRNRFVNNGVPGNLPPGVNPAGIDPVAAVDGDVSVSFSQATPAPATTIQLFAEHNYWGGVAPAISTTSGGAPATDIYFTPGGVIFAGVT